MENPITFIPLEKANIETGLALQQTFYTAEGYPFDTDLHRQNMLAFIEKPYLGRLWIISVEGQPAGYVLLSQFFSFEFGGLCAFLDELYIDAAYRGKGLGSSAILHVQEFAKTDNLKALYLETEPYNEGARKLYKKMNFEEHRRSIMLYTRKD